MKKHILITNGMARSGKDTFANYLGSFVPTKKYSSIDKVKDIARVCGWRGGKSERDRKFLSDLKELTTEYCDMAFMDIKGEVAAFKFIENPFKVLCIDIREPAEIARACREFGAKSVLIKNDRVPFVASNMGDAGVYDCDYDYVIENNGTLEEFYDKVKEFYETYIREG